MAEEQDETKTVKAEEQDETKTVKAEEQDETKTVKAEEQDETKTVKAEEQDETKTVKAEEQDETKTVEAEETAKKERSAMLNTEAPVIPPKLAPSLSRLKMRRHSLGFSAVQGIKRTDGGGASQLGMEYKRPILSFEPTYQMEPLTKFKCHEVEKIINGLLDSVYNEHVYHIETSPVLAISLANKIVQETKKKRYNRYRVMCIVVLGQKRAQCYSNAISLIWDKERDAYVDVQRENHTSFIQVTVFGIYLD